MIKVLNIISDTNIGGAGMVLENYLRYMDRENFSVSVALPKNSLLTPKLRPYGVTVYELDGLADKSVDFGAIKELKAVIKKDGPDIVHTHGAFVGRIAGKQCGKKVVFTRHSGFPLSDKVKKQPFKAVYKYLAEHYTDKIICVSPICRDYLLEVGVKEDIFAIVINGVDKDERADGETVLGMRRRFGAEGYFTAGVAARIEPYKGQDVLVRAARILKDRGRRLKLVCAGTGSFEDEVKKLAADLDVEDTVVFPGFISEMPAFLSALDVQLNVSHIEATSLSLLEGLSIGLPAIVSNIPGNAGVIRDGETGLIFPEGDASALADAIEKVMDSPELLKKWGENALKDYEARFTGKVFAENTEAVYREVMEVYDGK